MSQWLSPQGGHLVGHEDEDIWGLRHELTLSGRNRPVQAIFESKLNQ